MMLVTSLVNINNDFTTASYIRKDQCSMHEQPIKLLSTPSNKQIIFLGRDLNFVRQSMEQIAEYTRRVDPRTPLIMPSIELFESPPKKCSHLKFAVNIYDILPRCVRAIYGNYYLHQGEYINLDANCHGFAMVAAGMLPVSPVDAYDPKFSPWACKRSKKIEIEDLQPGDYIHGGQHSFVYISPELSIHMNGRNKEVFIISTPTILEMCDFKPETLEQRISHPGMTIYRRTKTLDLFETLIPPLLEAIEINFETPRAFTDQKRGPSVLERVRYIEKQIKHSAEIQRRYSKKIKDKMAFDFTVRKIGNHLKLKEFRLDFSEVTYKILLPQAYLNEKVIVQINDAWTGKVDYRLQELLTFKENQPYKCPNWKVLAGLVCVVFYVVALASLYRSKRSD